jgi:hypothetical protein
LRLDESMDAWTLTWFLLKPGTTFKVNDFVASAEGTILLDGVEKSLNGGSPELAMQRFYKAVTEKYKLLTNGAGSCYPVRNFPFHPVLT